ncbi:hypothetical protein [Vibrio sp. SCSIO 43137]|uniref:hypothetical protein n=1 Tax=Vibrio sp. SCSIO 43137 TaxID=3021011 RepID=UPI0023070655|nr:hypothetical protein [Vibrio sp. SCSIO 43137]WCE32156.1 hypothetical protein PK654_16785 [Vibrio sp. SCSIO 43137]
MVRITGKIRVTGDKDLPVWSIAHYLDQTSSNYNKLMMISRMCELTAEDIDQKDFLISKESIDVFSDKGVQFGVFKEHLDINLDRKGDDPSKFWNILRTYKRPVIYYRSENNVIPVFDPDGQYKFKVTKLEVNSPPSFDITGFVGGLAELITAGRNDRREERRLQIDEIEAENRILGQRAQNLERLATASAALNKEGVHAGIKRYAELEINHIMDAQARLNKKASINSLNVDV